MIRFAIFFICMILGVGSIDGPVGHESDNWIGFWIFTIVGFTAGISAILSGKLSQ